MKKRQSKLRVTYPQHAFKPEDLLHFIELPGFTDEWDKKLKLCDADLLALQVAIMTHPKGGAVIAGTGGARKIRFAPEEWKRGKRGAARVIYGYFERYGIVLLIVVYSKNESDDISAEGKKAIEKLMRQTKAEFRKRFGY